MNRKLLAVAVAGLLGAVLLLGGCADRREGSGGTSSPSAQAPSPGSARDEGGKEGMERPPEGGREKRVKGGPEMAEKEGGHGAAEKEEGHGAVSAEVPADAPVVEVKMEGMRFLPDRFRFEKGKPVRFRVENRDTVPHDFMVDGAFDTGTLSSGETAEVGWIPQSAGKFTAYCSQPGHREAGMVAEVEVQ